VLQDVRAFLEHDGPVEHALTNCRPDGLFLKTSLNGRSNEYWFGPYWPGDPTKDNTRIRAIADIPSLESFEDQRIDDIVEEFICAGTVNMLSSEPGAGKTFLTLAVCGAVASGQPFCGRDTLRRPVLYLDRENPRAEVARRMKQLGLVTSNRFIIWGGWCPDEPPDVSSPIITEWVRTTDPRPFIVVDSLAAFFNGAENDAADTRRCMQGFRRLANMGATVLVLHNSGKADTAKDYRGSSDIKASVDCAFHLTSNPGLLRELHLRAFKARYPIAMEIGFLFDDTRGFSANERPAERTREEQLRELLIAHPDITSARFEALAKKFGRNNARKFLKTHIEDNFIEVRTGGHNARLHKWKGK
jgi:predicted ATP-dependent serine protease